MRREWGLKITPKRDSDSDCALCPNFPETGITEKGDMLFIILLSLILTENFKTEKIRYKKEGPISDQKSTKPN